jgi:hypothetical protein
MARIVAIMLFLCKFFFQLFRAVHQIPGVPFGMQLAQTLMGFKTRPRGPPSMLFQVRGVLCQKSGWYGRGMAQLFMTSRTRK